MKKTKGTEDLKFGSNNKRALPASTSKPIVMYTTRFCPFCIRARGLLESKGWDYQDIPVDADEGSRSEMRRKSGQNTVPQIWVGDHYVGGCEELFGLEVSNKLEAIVIGENQ